jgi:hypothetical protein
MFCSQKFRAILLKTLTNTDENLFMKKLFCLATLLVASFSSQSSLLHDSDITPGVIFGSGNANGGWTIFQDSRNGLELGLRAKLRHDENGDPQNQFNSNGDGTYTFDAVSAPTQSNYVGVWSFEWAVNTNYNNRGRRPLDLLLLILLMVRTLQRIWSFGIMR